MNSFFDTDRLKADRICGDHAEWLASMYQNPIVMESLGGVPSPEENRLRFRNCIKHWDDYGYGIWIISEKESGVPIGRAGFNPRSIAFTEEVELVYAFLPDSWGKGYATEIGKKIIEMVPVWELPLGEIVCFTTHDNTPSVRVMEKLGFKYETDFDNQGYASKLYRLHFV